jgi:hypothetical protein
MADGRCPRFSQGIHRSRRQALPLLLSIMFQLGHGLLSRSVGIGTSSYTRRSLSSYFDDFMDEVLSGRGTIEPTSLRAADNSGWRRIDWNQQVAKHSNAPAPPPSPVDVVMIRDRLVYIKRDDQVSWKVHRKCSVPYVLSVCPTWS